MRIPESLRERMPFLETLEDDWEPVPRWAAAIWLIFYGLFLIQAGYGHGPFLLMDLVLVPIHEGGHLLFGYLGQTLGVAGGTILQLGVPLALATYFVFQRQVQGAAFCLFFFFEQFLPVATYMADARAQELPLLTIGDGDDVIHDWNFLFGKFGLLPHDVEIAGAVRVAGWLGMIAVTGWLARRSFFTSPASKD